jgi:NADPH-dependent 2,4-dienoyl-CoA reductase/sulfur reductase-like enzyme
MNRPRRIVVIGASLAGLNAVQAAREAGFDGELILIGDEPHAPYDRPPLSKDCLRGAASPSLCSEEAVRCELKVDLRLGAPAESLDARGRTLRLRGEEIAFDAALIACGLRARRPFSGAHAIRTLEDAAALSAALDSSCSLIIIGGGFIGFEAASIARARGLDVTILEALATPLARSVGPRAGDALARRMRRRGVKIETGAQVEALEQGRVHLAHGRRLSADAILLSMGAEPATQWLAGSGLTLENGVVCDERLNAGFAGLYAAGDVARWPNAFSGGLARIEHWTNAVDQGRHAMLNLLDPQAATPYNTVPYFWSDWSADALQFAGAAQGEPELVHGDWDSDSFVALYFAGDAFRGALTLNRRADIMKYRALLDRGAAATEARAFAESRSRRAPAPAT